MGAAAVLVLLLAGCSAPAAPPPGLTDAQLQAMEKVQSDSAWNALHLSIAIPKPDIHGRLAHERCELV